MLKQPLLVSAVTVASLAGMVFSAPVLMGQQAHLKKTHSSANKVKQVEGKEAAATSQEGELPRNLKAIVIGHSNGHVLMVSPHPKSGSVGTKGWHFVRGTHEQLKDHGDLKKTALREWNEETGNPTGKVRTNVEGRVINRTKKDNYGKDKQEELHVHILDASRHAKLDKGTDALNRDQEWVPIDKVKGKLDEYRREMHDAWDYAHPFLKEHPLLPAPSAPPAPKFKPVREQIQQHVQQHKAAKKTQAHQQD